MKHRIGINPISWSNDDLQYVGGDISLETCLSEASAAGYDGVELGHKFPREPSVLRPVLDAHGLALVSGWYSGRLLQQDADEEFRNMAAHANLLSAMECDVLIFAEVTACVHSDKRARFSQRPRMNLSQWREFGKRLSRVAIRTADQGMKLCYHHHMGTVVQSHEDIDALMQETTDEVYLLLDTGHALFAGADPAQLARSYACRIGHVHCKDIRRAVMQASLNRDDSFLGAVLDGVFTVPGDGCIDYDAIFSTLSGVGYSGWFVVEAEQDASVAPPAHYARLGATNLESVLKRTFAA